MTEQLDLLIEVRPVTQGLIKYADDLAWLRRCT